MNSPDEPFAKLRPVDDLGAREADLTPDVQSMGEDGPPAPPRDTAPPADHDDPRSPIERAADEPMNDTGNAARFRIHFGPDVMFVPRRGWFVWTTKVWQADEDELMVRTLAQKLGPLIEAETQYMSVPDAEADMMMRRKVLDARIGVLSDITAAKRTPAERAELREARAERDGIDATLDKIGGQIGQRLAFAKKTGNTGSIDNLLKEASVGLAVPLAELDADPMEINTESGILRFTVGPDPATGKGLMAQVVQRPHDRAARMTKIMPVRWDPKAKPGAEAFHTFFGRIQPDGMIRAFLSLLMHAVLLRNARSNALAQRRFAVQMEEDMHAARRGIPFCDAVVDRYDAKVRELKIELRARRLAKVFKGVA